MTVLFETSRKRTLTQLVERFASAAPGTRVEAWVFEDAAARRDAAQRLRGVGVDAVFRSAYKPLVCAFLEEIDTTHATRIAVGYPHHDTAPGARFRLEAYPLAAMVGESELELYGTGRADANYRVALRDAAGGCLETAVFAPNREHVDHTGAKRRSPCGWLRVTAPDGESSDEPLETDFEALFAALMGFVQSHPWGQREPYFEELRIEVTLPAGDEPLGVEDEVLSLKEALHEEIYFSVLEYFQLYSGRELGERSLQPGQIAPFVSHSTEQSLTLRVSSQPLDVVGDTAGVQAPEHAAAPLGTAEIEAQLTRLGLEPFTAQSRAGRCVWGVYKSGTERPVLISGGQHANETSGVVGVLRAIGALNERPAAHFAAIALENPDGYRLHERLRAANPHHMHHAARYTALGDDLEYRAAPPYYERNARHAALRLCGPGLHINLHGYPAHEWTRPLTGYTPRHFEQWSIPKGFFLIVRHWHAYEAVARRLMEAVTQRLAANVALVELTERQLQLYQRHAGEPGLEISNGFAVAIVANDHGDVPVTLITEYPDETIYGDAFRLAHTAQMATVLAAYAHWQDDDLCAASL